jgi:hypothetical protein
MMYPAVCAPITRSIGLMMRAASSHAATIDALSCILASSSQASTHSAIESLLHHHTKNQTCGASADSLRFEHILAAASAFYRRPATSLKVAPSVAVAAPPSSRVLLLMCGLQVLGRIEEYYGRLWMQNKCR